MDERRNERDQGLQRARVGLPDFNRDRLRGAGAGERRRGSAIGFVEFAAQILQDLGRAFEGAGCRRGGTHAVNFFAQCRLIAGQITRKLVDLRDHQAAQTEDGTERDENDDRHRDETRQEPALQQADQRREHEAHEDRKRDRHQNLAPEIKRGHHDHRHQHGRERRPGVGEAALAACGQWFQHGCSP